MQRCWVSRGTARVGHAFPHPLWLGLLLRVTVPAKRKGTFTLPDPTWTLSAWADPAPVGSSDTIPGPAQTGQRASQAQGEFIPGALLFPMLL